MQTTNTPITPRQALLNSMPAIPVAGALVGPVATQDPHGEWLIVIDQSWQSMESRPGLPDWGMDQLAGNVARHQELIAETSAHSFEGVVAQIKIGFYAVDGLAPREVGMRALDNAIEAIKELASTGDLSVLGRSP